MSISTGPGTFYWQNQSAGLTSGWIQTQEQNTVGPPSTGCYTPSSSATGVTVVFSFTFSGTMSESITCPSTAVSYISLTLYANVFSSTSGAIFGTSPSTTAVNAGLACPTTSYNAMPITTQTVSVGPFTVTEGVSYAFWAQAELYNSVTVPAGISGSSSEGNFQITLSSIVCGACP